MQRFYAYVHNVKKYDTRHKLRGFMPSSAEESGAIDQNAAALERSSTDDIEVVERIEPMEGEKEDDVEIVERIEPKEGEKEDDERNEPKEGEKKSKRSRRFPPKVSEGYPRVSCIEELTATLARSLAAMLREHHNERVELNRTSPEEEPWEEQSYDNVCWKFRAHYVEAVDRKHIRDWTNGMFRFTSADGTDFYPTGVCSPSTRFLREVFISRLVLKLARADYKVDAGFL